MIRRSKQFRHDERGQVIVLVAILFLALVFMVALVVNTGQLFIARRTAQGAADAAALAGAYALQHGNASDAQTAAQQTAALYGYDYSAGEVTINIPPLSGTHKDADHVEVIVSRPISASLVPSWGLTTIAGRGVASSGKAGSAGNTVYAIGNDASKPGISVGNGGLLVMCNGKGLASPQPPSPAPPRCVEGGIAQINSTSTDKAAYNQGANNVFPTGAPPTGAVTKAAGGITGVWPNPHPNCLASSACSQSDLQDPLAGYGKPQPLCGASDATCWLQDETQNWCRMNGWDGTTAKCALVNTNNQLRCTGGTQTLKPGLYTKTISGASCSWTFEPGVYVFEGNQAGIGGSANMSVQQTRDASLGACGASPLKPCGVLLFFTYGNYPSGNPSGGCAAMNFSGNNPWNLADEPGGTSTGTVTYSPWAGMVIYYDPAPASDGSLYCSGANAPVFHISGSSTLGLSAESGLIYAPKADLVIGGTNPKVILAQIVVDQVIVSQGTLIVNLGQLLTVPALPPRLVE